VRNSPTLRFFGGKFEGNDKKRSGNGEANVLSLFDYGNGKPGGEVSAYPLFARRVSEVIED
jgi:hypothetical protein